MEKSLQSMNSSSAIQREARHRDQLLRKDGELTQIFTVFAALSLNLLPYFASDYPAEDKTGYYKKMQSWTAL